jgi:hypothetical protein
MVYTESLNLSGPQVLQVRILSFALQLGRPMRGTAQTRFKSSQLLHGLLSQLVEETDSNPVQSEFDSLVGYLVSDDKAVTASAFGVALRV